MDVGDDPVGLMLEGDDPLCILSVGLAEMSDTFLCNIGKPLEESGVLFVARWPEQVCQSALDGLFHCQTPIDRPHAIRVWRAHWPPSVDANCDGRMPPQKRRVYRCLGRRGRGFGILWRASQGTSGIARARPAAASKQPRASLRHPVPSRWNLCTSGVTLVTGRKARS